MECSSRNGFGLAKNRQAGAFGTFVGQKYKKIDITSDLEIASEQNHPNGISPSPRINKNKENLPTIPNWQRTISPLRFFAEKAQKRAGVTEGVNIPHRTGEIAHFKT